MTRIRYDDQEQEEFVEVAQEMGIGPAMRELGYPGSYHTAQRWLEDRGIEISVSTLKSRAAKLGHFYGQKEKALVAQGIIDRIMEMVEVDELDADGINKIANAYQRAVQTLNLVTGEATDRKESISKDGTDLELQELINEQRAKNATEEAKMVEQDSDSHSTT